MRLDKFFCNCTGATRTEAKKIIKAKTVYVKGQIENKPEFKVNENDDIVIYGGKELKFEKYSYYLFHKPMGCVTAKNDNLHKTVMDYLPAELQNDFAPVGRLDLDTEGVLIITNDGELTHHLISPSHHVDKTYYALVDAKLDESAVSAFAKGIDIGDDNLTLPAKLTILDGKTEYNGKSCYPVEITINEGRYHQVKRMTKAVGAEVVYLKRISMGNIKLENLEKGCFRKLSEDEVLKLKQS